MSDTILWLVFTVSIQYVRTYVYSEIVFLRHRFIRRWSAVSGDLRNFIWTKLIFIIVTCGTLSVPKGITKWVDVISWHKSSVGSLQTIYVWLFAYISKETNVCASICFLSDVHHTLYYCRTIRELAYVHILRLRKLKFSFEVDVHNELFESLSARTNPPKRWAHNFPCQQLIWNYE